MKPPCALLASTLLLTAAVLHAQPGRARHPINAVAIDALAIEALAATAWVEEFDVSPDGALVAFKSAKAGTYDIWTVPVVGGEPRRLTELPGREMAPRFSPDGRYVVFEADYGGTEIRDLYRVPSSGGRVERLTDHPLDDRGISWYSDGSKVFFSTQRYWDRSLAVIDLGTREVQRVGPGGGRVSPDGTRVVWTRNSKPNDDDQSNDDIYVSTLGGAGEPTLLTPDSLDALDRAPEWSPDSRRIAFVSDRNGWNNIGVIDVDSHELRMLFDEPIEHSEPRWSPDGKFLSFTKNLDYHYQIFVHDFGRGTTRQLTHMPGVNGGSSATGQTRGDHHWLPNGSAIVATHSDPSRTGDLWVFPLDGREPRQLTRHQSPRLAEHERFVWPELVEYRSFDGLEVAGLVYRPHGAPAGARLPALFFFRANSNGQHPVQWNPYIQYFASRGFLVFAPNFRGSTGRGKAYRQKVHRHGGDHDLRDAFIGMDRLVEQGWVDPDRVGAFGGSTGGFFTTTAVTKEPDRFKAGVVWYGSTDLVTLSSYAGMEGWNRYLIGDTPLQNPQSYYERSIIYHADTVDTPLLFLYAQGDPAARFQQIEQYGVQARVHGNWFDWVVYGGEPHGWYHWRPDSIQKSLTIMEQMFASFLLGENHDVHALAEHQREGIELTRNPTIDLWNSLTHGSKR